MYTFRIAIDFIRYLGVEPLKHPPYSPDLAPSYYCLFPQLKKSVKGHKFLFTEEVIEDFNFFFKKLKALQACFSINLREEYVERLNIILSFQLVLLQQ